VLLLAPENQSALSIIARMAFSAQDYVTSQSAFEKIIALNAEASFAYKGLITAYEMQRQREKGVARVVALSEKYSSANAPLTVLIEYFTRRQDFDKALHYLVALEQRGPNAELASNLDSTATTAAILRGTLAEAQGQYAVAATTYQEQWNKNPNSAIAKKYFSLLNRTKKMDEANAFLDKWINAFPSSAQPLILKATIEQQAGNNGSAASLYEKAYRNAPNSFVALNNLAWIYDQAGDPRAMETAQKAYDIAPKDRADVMDTYGWLLVRNGRREEGIPLLIKANQTAPDNTEIKKHLQQALDK